MNVLLQKKLKHILSLYLDTLSVRMSIQLNIILSYQLLMCFGLIKSVKYLNNYNVRMSEFSEIIELHSITKTIKARKEFNITIKRQTFNILNLK